MENFRRLWSDNGDAMSMLYAGTRLTIIICFNIRLCMKFLMPFGC